MLKNHQLGSLPAIAVVIPCFNEALAITAVLDEFKAALPEATVYVFDNNSTDDTARIAVSCGATVIPVLMRGKGNVIRRMFADVQADIYVMVDSNRRPQVDSVFVYRLVTSTHDQYQRNEEPLFTRRAVPKSLSPSSPATHDTELLTRAAP